MDNKTYLDWDDITLIPSVQTQIESRKEINIYDDFKMLPLMVAPMHGIIDKDNYDLFIKNNIYATIPRKEFFDGYYEERWANHMIVSISLKEAKHILEPYMRPIKSGIDEGRITTICIDIANGHMESVEAVLHHVKNNCNVKIMVGNIAHPRTFKILSEAGADYIRVGIGSGAGCLTSQQTSIHYPMMSLISDVYRLKIQDGLTAKIVADGGFKKYSDIIKALAVGSDYVMVGSIFNKALEASAKTRAWKIFPVPKFTHNFLYRLRIPLYHLFFGMSTKLAQTLWGNRQMKTSEGITKYQRVEYTLNQWTENFCDYLRSSMSYTNSLNLVSFKDSEYIQISTNSLKRFKK